MKPKANMVIADGARRAPSASTSIAASKATTPQQSDQQARLRKRRGAVCDLDGGLPPYATIREFAAFARVHPRTISRDIDDGLLVANYFRSARRISRADGLTYLRKTRTHFDGSKRRRAPRKRCAETTSADPEVS